MSARRSLVYVASGLGAAAVAAIATGVVAERRVVRARRAGAAGADRLGDLRATPVEVTCDDGLVLHAEVDEVAPYAEGGTGRQEHLTVVFVHGYALNLDCWHFQREAFRGKHRMVFFDQRSHGRSERSRRENATVDQCGDDLAAVITQLLPEGDDVVLVGHSMGGMSVIAFAERHRELFAQRVRGVALISTTAGGLRPHRTVAGRLLPDRIGTTVAPRLIAALARAPELVDSARRSGSNIGFIVADLFAFGKDVPAEQVEFLDEMLAGTPFEVLAEFFPTFSELDKFEHLGGLHGVPTTIIGGTKDKLTSIGHSRKMARYLPHAELVECAGAGHMVIFEGREQVNAALDRLVTKAAR